MPESIKSVKSRVSTAEKHVSEAEPPAEPYVSKDPFEREFYASYPQNAPSSVGSGHPGNLDKLQTQGLLALREVLQAEGYEKRLDDATLLRFLRARQFDVLRAHEMYVECEKWRKEEDIDNILTNFVYEEKAEVMKLYPQFYHKSDKDGRPVYYEDLSKISVSKLMLITSEERMLKNLVWEYEAFVKYRLPACSRQAGHLVETSCTVLDLKNISLGTARKVYNYIRQATHVGQNYYPERMGKFYVINAPWGFSTVWGIIKGFLDPVTVEKVHILGSSYKSELIGQITEENLPEEYGGKSTTEGPIYLADAGPWRDTKYVGPEGVAPISGKPTQGSQEPSLDEKLGDLSVGDKATA